MPDIDPTQRSILLAIDDDPWRYDGLVRLLEQREDAPRLIVAACSRCVLEWLPLAKAVLLDYDLDSGVVCSCCGENIPDRDKAIAFAPELSDAAVPIVVVSASYRENVDRMVASLQRRGVKRLSRYSAHDSLPEPHWVAALWSWGIL